MASSQTDDKVVEFLKEADELVTRYLPQAVAATWNRNMEILGIYAVFTQMWQDPKGTLGEYVRAIQPVIMAVYEMGRDAERNGTA